MWQNVLVTQNAGTETSLRPKWQDSKLKFWEVTQQLLSKLRPCTPALNRWTKCLQPCRFYFFFLTYCNGRFLRAWNNMFGRKSVQKPDCESLVDLSVAADGKDLFYLAQGVRSKKASEWFNNPRTAPTVMVHVISQRPCELMLAHFFREQAEQVWKGMESRLPLVDLASEAFSPAASCVSDYITLLTLGNSQLQYFLGGYGPERNLPFVSSSLG